jgi:hypothetical protein
MRTSAFLLFYFASLTVEAPAGTSADYRTDFETTGMSAGASASANYTQSAESDGESASVCASGDAFYKARQGFAGQLYAVDGITFYGQDFGDEVTELQLEPGAILDDGTAITARTLFTYTNTDPPYVQSVSEDGEMVLGAVYDLTPSSAQAAFEGVSGLFTFEIRDVLPDNFGLYASDGIQDWWQVGYFGENNPAGAAGADPDGDTWTNLFEYRAQLLPNDAASRFQQSFRIVGDTGEITYGPVMPGTQYQTCFTTDFVTWTPLAGEVPTFSGGLRTDYDPDATTEGTRRFYRVDVSRP